MDEIEKKRSIFSPEKLVAYMAVLVGLCALGVSIYEANIFRQQQKASVWPYLEFSYSNIDGFSYNLKNKGVGPAIIKWIVVKIDGIPIKSWKEYGKKIFEVDKSNVDYVSSFISERVISSNENIRIILFKDPATIRTVLKNISRISFQICYSSIFDDHWIIKMDCSKN